jgi:replicative DNA helicase
VLFLFREEYYLAQQEPHSRPEESIDRFNDRYERWKEQSEGAFGVAEAILAKNRQGPTAICRLHFSAELMQFDNYAGPERLPAASY